MSTPVVRCYSGHRYAQEPQSFEHDGCSYSVARVQSVERVLDAATGRVAMVFVVQATCVEATSGNVQGTARFRLSYDEATDTWQVKTA